MLAMRYKYEFYVFCMQTCNNYPFNNCHSNLLCPSAAEMKSDIGPIWKLVISVHSFIHRLEFDLINKAGAEWRAD